MKKETINNYYTDEDLINFKKLNNFKEFKGDKLNKEQFLDYLMTGIRDQVTAEDRRLIYENDSIIVSHSVLESKEFGKNAVMLVRLVKDGKIIRQESGATPVPI